MCVRGWDGGWGDGVEDRGRCAVRSPECDVRYSICLGRWDSGGWGAYACGSSLGKRLCRGTTGAPVGYEHTGMLWGREERRHDAPRGGRPALRMTEP